MPRVASIRRSPGISNALHDGDRLATHITRCEQIAVSHGASDSPASRLSFTQQPLPSLLDVVEDPSLGAPGPSLGGPGRLIEDLGHSPHAVVDLSADHSGHTMSSRLEELRLQVDDLSELSRRGDRLAQSVVSKNPERSSQCGVSEQAIYLCAPLVEGDQPRVGLDDDSRLVFDLVADRHSLPLVRGVRTGARFRPDFTKQLDCSPALRGAYTEELRRSTALAEAA